MIACLLMFVEFRRQFNYSCRDAYSGGRHVDSCSSFTAVEKGKQMIKRLKKALTAIPASIAEAAGYLASIGEKQREINKIKREAKKQIEEINAEAKKKLGVIVKDRDAFFNALFAFAAPRKAELTRETRSQVTSTGTFGWRWTPPAVELADGKTDEDIIRSLEKRELFQYIRVVKELDREALLRDRPLISGVSYTQRDEFFAKPKMKREEGRAEELVRTEAIDV